MNESVVRRILPAELAVAVLTALLGVVAVVGAGMKVDLPWWALAAVALPTAGFAGWTGAQIGRRRGIRNEVLEPGETVVATYTVRPPYAEHAPPAAHEGPQYQLRVTTKSLEMWERSALLWRHPLSELRLIADGPRLRVHHGEHEVGTMLLERPDALHEIRHAARRYGAV
ncbi:hypothetical protein LRS74_00475 [Streptomyces sp. LX-29]|uniref:hypothetical protein n=1 Tax=Streptomyces sp. LX-29 TaxID=2900152 RepID=UPI00240E0ACF|nr:hypothetical protein [Streptomyces sp. LX-29]WFB05656.1 hypothetical protein LRS74_00475 [Streptomyces sp. LX-29]